jgi:tetratricopeptide (TPR) repeat protein
MVRSGRGAVGVPRGDPPREAQVVTPMFGAVVLGVRPELSWPAAAGVDGYRVQLLSGSEGADERTLWRQMTKEPRLPYPEKEKPLAAGVKYRWRVTAVRDGDVEQPVVAEGKFFTPTEEESAELARIKPLAERKEPAELLLAATTYEAHGVYGEALALYERLAGLAKDEPNFRVALANYYERAGLKEKARQARQEARKLGADVSDK